MATTEFADFRHETFRLENGLRMKVRSAGEGPAVVLLHGWPQHSLMWHRIAPRLTERFTVIAPDLRGAGGSSIPTSGYDKKTMAEDVAGLLAQMGVGAAMVAGYDLGSGVAYSLAAQRRDLVTRLAVMEFGLPGFGYESLLAPTPEWDAGSNWHLGFFTVPQIAETFLRGRERELLTWFFWHIANDESAVSPAHFEEYLRQICKPGALRAGIEYYAAVWTDREDNLALAKQPLDCPVLAIGGAASSGPYVEQLFKPVARDVRGVVIERAGHWLGDENPGAVADALLAFFGEASPAT